MSFLKSLTSNSNKFDKPFPHWELNNPLSEEAVNEIINADIANPNEHKLKYDGTVSYTHLTLPTTPYV